MQSREPQINGLVESGKAREFVVSRAGRLSRLMALKAPLVILEGEWTLLTDAMEAFRLTEGYNREDMLAKKEKDRLEFEARLEADPELKEQFYRELDELLTLQQESVRGEVVPFSKRPLTTENFDQTFPNRKIKRKDDEPPR